MQDFICIAVQTEVCSIYASKCLLDQSVKSWFNLLRSKLSLSCVVVMVTFSVPQASKSIDIAAVAMSLCCRVILIVSAVCQVLAISACRHHRRTVSPRTSLPPGADFCCLLLSVWLMVEAGRFLCWPGPVFIFGKLCVKISRIGLYFCLLELW